MAYFPLYIDMKNLKVLLVGGSTIACEKLGKLLLFTKEITVISSTIKKETQLLITEHNLTFYQRAYQVGDIDGFDIVVVATNTLDLHQSIYEESRGSRILINSVDNTKYCDFIFPSFIQKGDLTVAISTNGASPAFTKKMRQYFEENIPNSVETFLRNMKNLRKTMPKGKARMKHFDYLVKGYFAKHFK